MRNSGIRHKTVSEIEEKSAEQSDRVTVFLYKTNACFVQNDTAKNVAKTPQVGAKRPDAGDLRLS